MAGDKKRRRYQGVLFTVRVTTNTHGLDGFEDIVQVINQFAFDASRWTVEKAANQGLPRLVRYLIEHPSHRAHPAYIAYLCNKGIERSAKKGDLQVLKDFDACFPNLVLTHAATAAAEGGHTKILEWLQARGSLVMWPVGAFVGAALRGQLDVLRWFTDQNIAPNRDLLLLDAVVDANGVVDANLDEVIQFLWPLYASRPEYSLYLGIFVSRAPVKMAQWMMANCSVDVLISIDRAAGRGDMEFLRWAQTKNATATTQAMDDAASEGHLEVVIWLHGTRTEGCTSAAMDKAACRGHFEVLKWIATHRSEGCTGEALFGAAINGHVDIILWLLERFPAVTCPLSTFDHACGFGHLDVVRLLTDRELGGGTHKAMDWAAANNHIHVLDYLQTTRGEGCTTAAMNGAAENGCIEALDWLAANREEGCTRAAMDLAVQNGHTAAAKWLLANRREGCSNRAIVFAARGGRTELMRWLEKHYPDRCSALSIDAAIASGNLECVKWCRERRGEFASATGVLSAVRRGYFSILEYLRLSGSSACASETFEIAVDSRQLYLSAWLADNYPHVAKRSYMVAASRQNRWSPQIIAIAFGRK